MERKKTRLMLWPIALMPAAVWGNMLVPMARAQIAPDGSLPTEVVGNGKIFIINGGQRAGSNLFHSFQEFSVPTEGRAYFNNDMDVENIFSRVTGGNISNINGLIRANGSANLFLLNPAGIMFGPKARLNIGGSFLGSTASSLLFPNGQEFRAINQPEQLLTINAPIGLWFRGNEGNIVNESVAEVPLNNGNIFPIGLRVKPGQNLGLVGGNVRGNGGIIRAPGGRVDLGGLTAAGTVGLNNDGSLSFPEGVARGNVEFNFAIVNVRRDGGGTITVNANDVNILGGTRLRSGIRPGLGSADAMAGNITIDATGAIAIDGSIVANQVGVQAIGDAGNIEIEGRSLSLSNGAELNNRKFGQGNAGNVTINVDSLELTSGGRISTPTFNSETPGSTTVKAATSISISGGDPNLGPSGIFADVQSGSTGNGNELSIETGSLLVEDGARISTNTFGKGNGGDLTISNAELVELRGDDAVITANTFGEGNAGNLTISNAELVKLSGEGSGLLTQVGQETTLGEETFAPAIGNGGELNISTNRLILQDGARISASTFGKGDAGKLTINATESVEVSSSNSGLFAQVNSEATGNGGSLQITTGELLVQEEASVSARTIGRGNANNLIIKTDRLLVRSGGQISASTFGPGNAGNLTVNASELIELTGTAPAGSSGIFSNAIAGTGNGGNLEIGTEELIIQDGASIGVSNFQSQNQLLPGSGNPGNINIQAGSVRLNDGNITAATVAGDRGNINLTTSGNIELRNGSRITTDAEEDATGGNIKIKTDFLIAYPGNNDITANANRGDGGRIEINADAILGIEKRDAQTGGNDITVSSTFGSPGEVILNIPDVESLQGRIEPSDNAVEAEEVIVQACRPDPEGEESSFTIVGRGGLPRGPQDPLTSDTMRVGGKLPSETAEAETRPPIVTLVEDTEPISPEDIVLARGWIVNEDGIVELTAYPTPYTSDRPFPHPVRCPRQK